ncbi:MAG: hypothetical protein QOE45_3424 [Frankiaceae bacterium]|nr:hypothetical protein [Frankiaceae bacterium]
MHRFADAHDGVVTVAAAARLGYDWSRLRAVLRDEGWVRLAPSAYARPDRAGDLTARVRAEQLRHPVVASHRTAAALYGGDVLAAGFDFTAAGTGRYDVPDGLLYRWTLAPDDVLTANGIRLTSPARTATDLLRALPRDEAVIGVDGLLRAGVVTLDAVADRLDALRGRRHTRRAWVAFCLLDPRSGSVAESKARLVLRDAALRPRSQVVLVDLVGRRIRVDLWFPAGVAVEVEGYAFHSTREQHQADVARFNELARVRGVQVLRFSWADVFHRPRAVVAAVRAALAIATGEPRLGAHGVR